MSTATSRIGEEGPHSHCIEIRWVWDTEEEREERQAIIDGWHKEGKIPMSLPRWVIYVLQNHGGGGGP